jgi:hypothetical protein
MSESDSAEDSEAGYPLLTHTEWVEKSAANDTFIKTHFTNKPRVSHTPGESWCNLTFTHFVKKHYNIKPAYHNLHVVWKVNPQTRITHHNFYKHRVLADRYNILNHRYKPQDRISFFPFSHHVLMIAVGKIPCDLEHNWSSLVVDTFPWPCRCDHPENACWEKDKKYKFPTSNTSGWISEPGYNTPFEVKPLKTILALASPKPRVYKRRKTNFSDRKGNR